MGEESRVVPDDAARAMATGRNGRGGWDVGHAAGRDGTRRKRARRLGCPGPRRACVLPLERLVGGVVLGSGAMRSSKRRYFTVSTTAPPPEP